jgi:hypothetical protein
MEEPFLSKPNAQRMFNTKLSQLPFKGVIRDKWESCRRITCAIGRG